MTIAIDEEIELGYLFMTHVVSLPYFLAVASIGLLLSVIIDEKMKASIMMTAILIGMFVFRSISLMAPNYENIRYLSLNNYFNPYDILKAGTIDAIGVVILIVVILECLLISMFIFERRDINVT